MYKNIYLLYPPGYSGSYISWVLYKSNIKTAEKTIDDPVNKQQSVMYGGEGTSHLHIRKPTHCGIQQLIQWLVLHRPTEKKVFLVNVHKPHDLFFSISEIISMDRDPVIIQISANAYDYKLFGSIQCATKWPVFLDVKNYTSKYNLQDNEKFETRNTYIKNYDEFFTDFPNRINFDDNSPINTYYFNWRTGYKNWYEIRNSKNPHEVNENEFVVPKLVPDFLYHIDLEDIFSDQLFSKLESICSLSDIGDFDFSHCKAFHNTYVSAQKNLQFFEDIKNFRNYKVVTEYLTSHPIIEAIAVREILHKLPKNFEYENFSLKHMVDYIDI